jgi:PTS system fructose-specific IIA component
MSEHGIEIKKVLLKDLFLVDIPAFESKESLFDFISNKFEEAKIVSNQAAFKESLNHREALGPTYMGDLIAIPHGQCEEVITSGVGFIRCNDSFQYQSAGEEGPVKYIFVLAVMNDQENNEHLRILATLAGYMMKDTFRKLLESVQTYEEMIAGIERLNEEDI